MSRAREEGAAAYGRTSPVHGGPVDLEDNPHSAGSAEAEEWAEGWRDRRGPLRFSSPGLHNLVDVQN